MSGALVETSTYYPNGARETYRAPDTENVAAEPYGFTGKEADEEVGVVYFGERYLIPRIGRWASPDPLSIHAAGGGEALNAYHYVSGNLLQARDPLGLETFVFGGNVDIGAHAIKLSFSFGVYGQVGPNGYEAGVFGESSLGGVTEEVTAGIGLQGTYAEGTIEDVEAANSGGVSADVGSFQLDLEGDVNRDVYSATFGRELDVMPIEKALPGALSHDVPDSSPWSKGTNTAGHYKFEMFSNAMNWLIDLAAGIDRDSAPAEAPRITPPAPPAQGPRSENLPNGGVCDTMPLPVPTLDGRGPLIDEYAFPDAAPWNPPSYETDTATSQSSLEPMSQGCPANTSCTDSTATESTPDEDPSTN